MARLLQRQRLVEDEAARSGKLAHGSRLAAVGHQFKFEGLKALHGFILPRFPGESRQADP